MEADKLSLYIVTATVLVTICLVIFFRSKTQKGPATWLLGAYFVAYLLTVVISYIVLSPYIDHVPHLFRTANLCFLLMVPLSYLYFRTSTSTRGLGWTDLLHFTPALLYVVDYFPFFMLSGQEKLDILHQLNRYGLKGGFNDGWLMPKGWNNLLRFVIFAGYWVAQCVLVYRSGTSDMPLRRKWLKALLYSQALMVFPAIILLLLGKYDVYNLMANFLGLVAALVQGYFLLMNPDILYEFPSEPVRDEQIETQTNVAFFRDPKSAGSNRAQASQESLSEIQVVLNRVMDEEKPFLNPSLKIYHLSELMGVPAYKISTYLNDHEQKNFHEFVNDRRIDFCIEKLRTGEGETKTLEALAMESGFNSRGTFIRAFKKKTGKTPSEYLQHPL